MNNVSKELKRLTRKYLRNSNSWDTKKYIKKYIKELLPKEIDFLRKNGRIKTSGADTLVQLVGFSWEPLLISVCAYKPQEIILILNKKYNAQSGDKRGEDFEEYISKLKEQNLIENVPKILPDPFEVIEKDGPEDVFKFLKKHVLSSINGGKKVVIDITGAKKSMVSGAYLFASYTNCAVSYLDFDKYDEEYGKPYGYTCKIKELENPMELFKLYEWNRVKELYRKYAFRSAMELIDEIKEGTCSFIEENEKEAIDHLVKCLKFYKTWDEGNYRRALDLYGGLQVKIPCPSAVEELGEIWYDESRLIESTKHLEGLQDISQSIYTKIDKIVIYAKDEIEKIKRLIKYREDYRSALLRAAGLSELLLRARLIKLWMEDKFLIEEDDGPNMRKDFSKPTKIDKKLTSLTIAPIIKALKKDKIGLDKKLKGYVRKDNSTFKEFWREIDSNNIQIPSEIFRLRNKAIHFCLSIPKEIAEVAVEFAEKNLEEFIKNWSKESDANGIYEAMSWYDLQDKCGVKFLPKLKEEENE